MKIKLDDELQEKVTKITGVDYTGELQLHDIENMIDDLLYWYHKLEEDYEDLKQNVEDNYEQIPYWKQVM